MADKQSIHRLVEHREELANILDPNVDSLVQKFSDLKLLSLTKIQKIWKLSQSRMN